MLLGCNADEIPVLPVVPVESIEPRQAQIAGQSTQMHVSYKACFPQRNGTGRRDTRDVECLEDGIDAHPVAIAGAVREADRTAVDQDQVDFCMRDPQSLDQILHRVSGRAPMLELPAPALRGQEITQFRIETYANGGHGSLLPAVYPSPASSPGHR
jgi:hypothetical protein